MQRTSRFRIMQSVLAMTLLFGVGGGCVAIYSFDEFEKTPPISCKVREDCPGTDLCGLRECVQGLCKRTNPVADGIYPSVQPAGDCKRLKCDGKGNDVLENDSNDLPTNSNECTEISCVDGVLQTKSLAGQSCGAPMAGLTCNAEGFCSGCKTAGDCGLPMNPCASFNCTDGLCNRTPQNLDFIVDNPIVGDCSAVVCTANGDAREGFAPADAIQDDNPCTIETCKPDGSVVSTIAPDGNKCGDCKVCSGGTCGSCMGAGLDCFNGDCVPKPQMCSSANECPTGYCKDGFCCQTECSDPCKACSNALTGAPSGLCLPVLDNTDPDNDCIVPAEDVCVGGACRCSNGIRDMGESGTDCGGTCNICSGTWNCGGVDACDGFVTPICCEDIGPLCFYCGTNQSAACKNLEGQTCTAGAMEQLFSLGVVGNGSCVSGQACKYVTCKCL